MLRDLSAAFARSSITREAIAAATNSSRAEVKEFVAQLPDAQDQVDKLRTRL
jgi:hypothetical protein